MDSRHRDMRGIAAGKHYDPLVRVPMTRQFVVAAPSVRADHRPGSNRVTHERSQTGTGDIRDLLQPYPTKALGVVDFEGNCDDRLGLCLPTSDPFFFSPNIGLVDFDCPRQSISPGSHHGTPQLVKEGPQAAS